MFLPFLQNLGMLGGGAPPEPSPPIIVTTSFATGYVDVPYSRGMVVTGLLPMTFAVIAGTLPDGLDIDADTGVVSGTPTTEEIQAGVEIEVTNADGTDSAIYTFTIEILTSSLQPVSSSEVSLAGVSLAGIDVGRAGVGAD